MELPRGFVKDTQLIHAKTELGIWDVIGANLGLITDSLDMGSGWHYIAQTAGLEEANVLYSIQSRCHVQNGLNCQKNLEQLNAAPFQFEMLSNDPYIIFGTICGKQGTGDTQQTGFDVAEKEYRT
jgi:hypothetical protein